MGSYLIKSNEENNILDEDNMLGFAHFYLEHNGSKILEDYDGWV